ncbi:shikimate dehydrogenase [Thalassospira sp. ER-Se-21-Dark]|uniref:shikimate dehydrogenase n=1 Tax=Thalassospira sp. ER-Se-21-Dark TaxID=2585190 RepID=UPI001B3048D2|nr:shikimate dehydrogenase [Thalassospira sp. ER-Se-21-Dark]MBP3125486.1 shikimate dehydrogenase [Thalassospira sp. ER-Se-21-Dark]
MTPHHTYRTLTGTSRLAGVMGWPVSHSKSPRLQGYWLAKYGIDGCYMPLPVKPENFETALKSLRDLGFAGVNVTIPHKEAAMAACDQLSDRAKRVGAVNTITFTENGEVLGDNTDGFGFVENLRQVAPDSAFASGPAVVLGAGGACRAVLVSLLEEDCPEIRLTNRTRKRAEDLATEINDPRIKVVDWPLAPDALLGASLVVNTTSLGMVGQPKLEIDLDGLPQTALVTDIVYAPLMTDLLVKARERGNPIVDGLGMLLHQARPGFHRWFAIDPEVTQELRDFVLSPD